MAGESKLPEILRKDRDEILNAWTREAAASVPRDGPGRGEDLRAQCTEFFQLLQDAVSAARPGDVHEREFAPVREMLGRLSRARGERGFTPTETATFIFSLKRPLFGSIRRELEGEPSLLVETTWEASDLLDRLGLFTTEEHQRSREEVISRQHQDMLELSTPVVKLWEGVLALPLIGTLDSARTQTVMETLLQRIVETGSEVAIIDITGVPTVDTLVAQHLMKAVAAARLMGVECIISGIRPQIAQTIVHLAVDLGDITTKATLAEAFRMALGRIGARVVRVQEEAREPTPPRTFAHGEGREAA